MDRFQLQREAYGEIADYCKNNIVNVDTSQWETWKIRV